MLEVSDQSGKLSDPLSFWSKLTGRRKWLNIFDSVTALVFLIAISECTYPPLYPRPKLINR
jgi:hypothetical protein